MEKEKNDLTRNMLIIGFMMFSTFFGAGNLIFPPYLGMVSGEQWHIGFLGFLIGDVTLAILAIIATCRFEDANKGVLTRGGKVFAILVSSAMVLCVGPFVCIPRTASTTFEISIQPFFPHFNTVLFSIIFFILVMFLTIRPTKVVDIVGKFLTPALLIVLALMIVKGILTPLGDAAPSKIDTVFAEGLVQGYQTFDAMGGTVVAILVMATIIEKGYGEKKARVHIAIRSGIIAGLGLLLVYGGLCYLGSTVSMMYGADIAQTTLLVNITNALFGTTGQALLGAIVILACLTTAIGLTSSVAQYFSPLTKGKLKYEVVVVAVCVFSAVTSNFGVAAIVGFSVPILTLLYPAVVTMIVLSTFTDQIKNDNIYKVAGYGALVIGLIDIIDDAIGVPFMQLLPLAKFGFSWVTPVVVLGIIGALIPCKKEKV